jgi:hypothetical protein
MSFWPIVIFTAGAIMAALQMSAPDPKLGFEVGCIMAFLFLVIVFSSRHRAKIGISVIALRFALVVGVLSWGLFFLLGFRFEGAELLLSGLVR